MLCCLFNVYVTFVSSQLVNIQFLFCWYACDWTFIMIFYYSSIRSPSLQNTVFSHFFHTQKVISLIFLIFLFISRKFWNFLSDNIFYAYISFLLHRIDSFCLRLRFFIQISIFIFIFFATKIHLSFSL